MNPGLAHPLLADRYRLLEQIAVGGMGEVWRAQDVLVARVMAKQPGDRFADAAAMAAAARQLRSALPGLGLVPRLAYDGVGTPVGTVSGVDPVGRLPVGSEVVLHVVPEPGPARGSAGGPPDAPPGQSRGRASS